MAKITLDVPDELHLKMKRKQLELEENGVKSNLKDLYYEVIKKGLEAEEKAKK
ncbi:hypothetical protein [Siphonobacter sp. SORGH_AS_0500]|uniref:hypothetical protein n=1 Tax=Siphonobacter sp. SORGH_AS_0500 TaxID=1864824 RepID=UPI0012FEB4A8|nr:hypothetical protein [Siphonobacter sp. SORGH_AS_0500]